MPGAYREWGVELFDWQTQCSCSAGAEGQLRCGRSPVGASCVWGWALLYLLYRRGADGAWVVEPYARESTCVGLVRLAWDAGQAAGRRSAAAVWH